MAGIERLTYLEWTKVGECARLAVIDAATGIEVVVMGPANADPRTIERVGLAKLLRALARAGVVQDTREGAPPHAPDQTSDRNTPLPRQRGFTA